jgi:hypothetical protein
METAVAQGGASRDWTLDPAATAGRARLIADQLRQLSRSTAFGNTVIILFFVAQALDGAFTYVGILMFGPSIEGNPLLAALMASFGVGPALAGAKLAAAGFGIILHLAAVHRAVAILTAIYVSAALLPWAFLLIVAGQLR